METVEKIKDGLLNSLTSIKTNIFESLPSIVGFILIVLIGLFVAKMIKKGVQKMLTKIGIDDFSEKHGLSESIEKFNKDLKLSSLLSKIVYWFIMLLLVIVVSESFELTMVSKGISEIVQYLPKLFIAIVIFVIGMIFAKTLKKVVYTATTSIGLSGSGVIANIVFYVILIFVSITALNQAGLDTTLITTNVVLIFGATLLAFSLAYAFAARDILTNILSSFYGKGRFSEGQFIKINGTKGKIIKIDSISITLQMEDKKIVIPAKKMISEEVEIFEDNESSMNNE